MTSPAKPCEKMECVPKWRKKKDFIFRWRELAGRAGAWMIPQSVQDPFTNAEPLTIKQEEEGVKQMSLLPCPK